jgi:hypothetical protein
MSLELDRRNSLMRNGDNRVEEAAQSIADAMVSLTHALCLLGFSEGKQVVQRAHGVVFDAHQYIQAQRN